MKTKNINNIIFDFDGVLVESVEVKTEAFAKMFEKYGKKIQQKVVNHHEKNGSMSRYKKLEYYYENFLNKSLDNKQLKKLGDQFSDLVVEKVVEAPYVDGAEYFLEKYRSEMSYYVVSGTPQEELENIINKRDMGKYFNKIYGSPTSKKDLVNKIINNDKLKKNKTIMIGDSKGDLLAAENNGIGFIGRITTRNVFYENTKLIENLNDLEKILV